MTPRDSPTKSSEAHAVGRFGSPAWTIPSPLANPRAPSNPVRKMPELLLELFSEEIPARFQRRAAEDLKKAVTDALVEAGLLYEGARPSSRRAGWR